MSSTIAFENENTLTSL